MKIKPKKEPAKKPEKMNWPKSEPVTLPVEQLTTAPWNPRGEIGLKEVPRSGCERAPSWFVENLKRVANLIQWPRAQYWDKPWNPWLGCKPISPACDNCYARCATVERFGQSFEPHKTHKVSPPNSGVVFCGNMTDLFGEWMNVMDSMDCFSRLWHFPDDHSGPKPNNATYLFCTKRVDRMCDALRNYTQIPHAYFGFTAENQEWYNKRMSIAREFRPFVEKSKTLAIHRTHVWSDRHGAL